MLTWLTIIAVATLLLSMSWSVIRARPSVKPAASAQLFLPNRLFISLILLVNFWLILLLLLGLRDIAVDDRQILVIIVSLFAPFLSWWRQKRAGEDH